MERHRELQHTQRKPCCLFFYLDGSETLVRSFRKQKKKQGDALLIQALLSWISKVNIKKASKSSDHLCVAICPRGFLWKKKKKRRCGPGQRRKWTEITLSQQTTTVCYLWIYGFIVSWCLVAPLFVILNYFYFISQLLECTKALAHLECNNLLSLN